MLHFAPRKMLRFAGLALLVCLAWPARARSQESSQAAAPLASLVATGSHRFSSDQIAAASGLHRGSAFAPADLQAVADRLAQLGPFTSVQYRYSSDASGLQVELQVADAPAVPALFDNFPWFTDEELKAALQSLVVLFDGTAPEVGTILDAMSAALGKLLETRGVHATVSHTLTNAPGSDQRLQLFEVQGAEMNVGAVQFSDALAQNDKNIQDRLFDLIGKPFSRSRIELFEFEQVRPVYLAHAFLRVQFGRPVARFAGDPNQPLPRSIVVLVAVDPGPVFRWGGVTWSGNTVIPTGELDKLVQLNPGNIVSGLLVEATWNAVRQAFGKLGYLDVKVDPAPQYDEAAKRVTYAVSIIEGPQYRMGQLVLTGLSLEGERRLRAAWKIAPGEIFDKTIYDEFLSSGIQGAFYGLPVHYDKIGRFLQEDSKTGVVDVLLDFQ